MAIKAGLVVVVSAAATVAALVLMFSQNGDGEHPSATSSAAPIALYVASSDAPVTAAGSSAVPAVPAAAPKADSEKANQTKLQMCLYQIDDLLASRSPGPQGKVKDKKGTWVIAAIKKIIDPASLKGEACINISGSLLVVNHTPDTHKKIYDWLKQIRQEPVSEPACDYPANDHFTATPQ